MILNFLLTALCKPEMASGAIECILRLMFSSEVRKHCFALGAMGCLYFGKLRRIRIRFEKGSPGATSRTVRKVRRRNRSRSSAERLAEMPLNARPRRNSKGT
jgi:hypothetical protein